MNLKLVSKKDENPGVITFQFEPEAPITWKAGQYMRYRIKNPNADDRGESRFFTIAAPPFEKNIQITTKISPEHSSTFKKDLNNLKIGAEIAATGPGGSFIVDNPDLKYIFIAGGIGITPFRSIILDLDYKKLPINITLLYANKTEDVVFKKELEEISLTHPEFRIHYFVGDNKIDQAALQPLTSNLQSPVFYISGPEPMMESFVQILIKMGVDEEKIKHDYFPGYTEI